MFFITLMQDYYLETTMENRIIFLSDEDQMKMSSKFVSNLPWHSFARKNVGYLYAVAQGAKIIYDFDDHNKLKFFLSKTRLPILFLTSTISMNMVQKVIFPYVYFSI